MWRGKSTKWVAGIAVTAAALFALGNARPASSSGSEQSTPKAPPITVPMPGKGWVTFALPAGVNPARTHQHLVQGKATGTACVFTNDVTAAPGFAGREDDEVALNPNTCRAVVATGPVQAADAQSDAPAQGLVLCECGGGGVQEAAYTKTWWTDPVSATVTSLRDDVDWITAGGCNSWFDPKHAQTHLWETGWILDYQDNFTHLDCGAAISNSDAKMENGIFPACAAAYETAYTHYNYNHEAVGKGDGSAEFAWNDYADSTFGICYRLLSWHDAYGFETPYG